MVDVAREALSNKEGFGANLDTDRKAAKSVQAISQLRRASIII